MRIKTLVGVGLGAAGSLLLPAVTSAQSNTEIVQADEQASQRTRLELELKSRVASIDRIHALTLRQIERAPIDDLLALGNAQLWKLKPVSDPELRLKLGAVQRRLHVELERELDSLGVRLEDLPRPQTKVLELSPPQMEAQQKLLWSSRRLQPSGDADPQHIPFVKQRRQQPWEVYHGSNTKTALEREGYYKDKAGRWRQRDSPIEKFGKILAVHLLESLIDAVLYPLWPEHDVRDDRGQVVGKEVDRSYRYVQKGLELMGYAWLTKHVGVLPTVAALIDHLGFVQDWMYYGHHWWFQKLGIVDHLMPERSRDKFNTEFLFPYLASHYEGWWDWTIPLGDAHLKAKLGNGQVYGTMLLQTSARALNISWSLMQLDATPLQYKDFSLGAKKGSLLYHPGHGLEWLVNGFAKLSPW